MTSSTGALGRVDTAGSCCCEGLQAGTRRCFVALGHCQKCRFPGFDFSLFLLLFGFRGQNFRQFPQEPEVQHWGTVSEVETGRKKPICHLIPERWHQERMAGQCGGPTSLVQISVGSRPSFILLQNQGLRTSKCPMSPASSKQGRAGVVKAGKRESRKSYSRGGDSLSTKTEKGN